MEKGIETMEREKREAMEQRERSRQPAPTRPENWPWLTMAEADLIEVLRVSLYPGASDASIRNAITYCRTNGYDIMLKPVHIVPMYVRNPDGRGGSMRDIIMPGINLYRVQAARSGAYMGLTAPEWGPIAEYQLGSEKISVPEWCRITVRRMVAGQVVEFTAEEYWIENYATKARDAKEPNAMWGRRSRGQLAKVTEAQALRKAFPEESPADTAEEMEGKVIDAGRIDENNGLIDKTPGAKAQLDRFSGNRIEDKSGTEAGTPIDDAKPRQREKEPAKRRGAKPDENMEAEARDADKKAVTLATEEPDEVPRMPADAENAWATEGKWAKGWRWLNEVMPAVGPVTRQALAEDHAALLWAVTKGGDAYRKAALDFVQRMGVIVPESKGGK